jgi:hypothetical protein
MPRSFPVGIGRSAGLRNAAALLACATVAALGLGMLAPKSFAGTYAATECWSGNGYSQAQYGEWNHHMLLVTRDCGAGGNGLGVGLPQAYWAGGAGRWTTYAAPNTHMVSIQGAFKGTSADGWWAWTAACSPSACVTQGPFNSRGAWQGFGFGAGYYTNWWVELGCSTGNCFGSPESAAFARDVLMVMSDDAAPSVSFRAPPSQQAGRGLLNGEVQRGTARLDLAPEDAGAGLTSVWALVNDQQVAAQSYGCGGTPMQPCPLDVGTAHFELDTQSAPFHDGDNTVQACAADYGAPPNVTCTARRVVRVDNSCTPSPVPGGSQLSAVFRRNHRPIVRVKAGQGALLTGRLTDAAGNPVAGAVLCASEAVSGDPMAMVGSLTTDANGGYGYRVSPGPDRKLRIAYRYDRNQIESRAEFKSRLRPALKLWPKRRTSNGKRIRMYGSIPGPRNSGRIVILQASALHSNSWLTFRKARTDALGNFTAHYRFSSTSTTTRYRFRAVVPAQNGYPYEGGTSRARKIKVIGR